MEMGKTTQMQAAAWAVVSFADPHGRRVSALFWCVHARPPRGAGGQGIGEQL